MYFAVNPLCVRVVEARSVRAAKAPKTVKSNLVLLNPNYCNLLQEHFFVLCSLL